MFAYIHGQQFWITEKYPKPGDLFLDLEDKSYSKCVGIGINGNTIERECICGMCSEPSRIIPISNCRKLKPVDIHNN